METPEEEIKRLRAEVAELKLRLAKAKNPDPVERPSLRRVMVLCANACMKLEKLNGLWVLSLGNLSRTFKRLKEIWDLFIQEDWILSNIFPQMSVPKPKQKVEKVTPRLPHRYPSLDYSFNLPWWQRERQQYLVKPT
jgi:hypothetical protein